MCTVTYRRKTIHCYAQSIDWGSRHLLTDTLFRGARAYKWDNCYTFSISDLLQSPWQTWPVAKMANTSIPRQGGSALGWRIAKFSLHIHLH